MITLEDWAEIRRLHRAEKMPIKAIARTLGVSKNTVRRALRASEPPRYERQGPGSIVDAVEPRIRLLLKDYPRMPATVIAERIGWDALDHGAAGPGAGAAAGVPAGRPGVADGV